MVIYKEGRMLDKLIIKRLFSSIIKVHRIALHHISLYRILSGFRNISHVFWSNQIGVFFSWNIYI